MRHSAPWWLPGGHAQTIWPALMGRKRLLPIAYQRERWNTPDQDFIDVDFQPLPNTQHVSRQHPPLLVLFHGLEGSSHSHYALAFADYARQCGWAYTVPHFRGCSGEINQAPRAYHSGDYTEIEWILQRLRARHAGPVVAVGVSLGGNALLRWAQERGDSAHELVHAIASVCAPVDLRASGEALARGFNRQVYTPMFLKTMQRKAQQKWEQFPGLFDLQAMREARTLYAFDDVFTAPLHGYQNAADYWTRASAKPQLHAIRVPTLMVHALNDPFVPHASLPGTHQVSSSVTLWRPAEGGHVGFAEGGPPGHLRALPAAIGSWFAQHLN